MMLKKLGKNKLCWCGSSLKYKNCHLMFDETIKQHIKKGHIIPSRDIIKNPQQIAGIRESCKRNIAILDRVSEKIQAGISTAEIDDIVSETTKALGGIAAPLDFNGYPKSVCVSINDQVCHGIPSEKICLKDGDIVNVDVSTYYEGYYSDSSRMFCIGNVSEANGKLVQVSRECIDIGLQKVMPWGLMGDMSHAIHEHALMNGYSVVREIGGHGIGMEFHEEPFISYVTKQGTGMLMVPGMIFTIEPMVNMGECEVIVDEDDGWTVYTADGKPSAQWEVSVLVTEDGHEVLAY